MNEDSTLSSMLKLPLFDAIPTKTLTALSKKCHIKNARKNTIVIMENDTSQSMFFILSGSVRAFQENEYGKEITLNELKEGQLFGELAWLCERPRCASIITNQDSKFLVINNSDLNNFFLEQPELMKNILLKLANQVASLSRHIETITLNSIQKKVMWAISTYGEKNNDNRLICKATHKDLANLIGSSRESVSRAIQELKSNGDIDARENVIYLNKSQHAGF